MPDDVGIFIAGMVFGWLSVVIINGFIAWHRSVFIARKKVK